MGEYHAEKIVKVQNMALKMARLSLTVIPAVRVEEGVAALSGFGKIFHNNTISSGVIPQISFHGTLQAAQYGSRLSRTSYSW